MNVGAWSNTAQAESPPMEALTLGSTGNLTAAYEAGPHDFLLTWGNVQRAAGFQIQHRVKGDAAWIPDYAAGAATDGAINGGFGSWTKNLAIDNVTYHDAITYEWQVRAIAP